MLQGEWEWARCESMARVTAMGHGSAEHQDVSGLGPFTVCGVGLYAHSLQEGGGEMGEKEFMMVGISLPR